MASCQAKYVSDEEFNEKITWLEPHEIYLQLVDVYKKNSRSKNYICLGG